MKFGDGISQSSALLKLSNFRYVPGFRNGSVSQATEIAKRGQISHFFARVKIMEGKNEQTV